MEQELLISDLIKELLAKMLDVGYTQLTIWRYVYSYDDQTYNSISTMVISSTTLDMFRSFCFRGNWQLKKTRFGDIVS